MSPFNPEHLLGARLPVDADLVLVQLLRGEVDAPVTTEVGPDDMANPPRLVATTFASSPVDGPLLHLRAGIQLTAWASKRAEASLVCRQAVAVLQMAWVTQRVVGAGHMRRFTLTAQPAEVRDDNQPDGMWRFDATGVGIFRAA